MAEGGWEADVDEGIAPLVLELWRNGIETAGSCQDVGESLAGLVAAQPHLGPLVERRRGVAYVQLWGLDDAARLFEAVANGGPRDELYERMAHWAAPGAWELQARVRDAVVDDGTEDWSRPSSFEPGVLTLHLPVADLPLVVERLARHRAGERGPHGEPAWAKMSGSEEALPFSGSDDDEGSA